MADLYLVRHGTTDLNDAGKLRAWMDEPLNDAGRETAHQLADYFDEHDVVKILASDLKRAKETADIIGAACACPVFALKEWRPWDLGKWAGQQSAPLVPEMLRCVNNPSESPPDGEPFLRFRARVTKAWSQAKREAMRSEGECFVIATHIRNIRLILGIEEYGPMSSQALTYIKQKADPIEPSGIVLVQRPNQVGPWRVDIVEKGMAATA